MQTVMMAARNRPTPIEDGLLGWWKLHGEDDPSAPEILRSGQRIADGPRGAFLRGASFEGSIVLAQPIALPGDLTLSAWVRQTALKGVDNSIFTAVHCHAHRWRLYPGAIPDVAIFEDESKPDVWEHIAFVREGGEVRGYRNGKLAAEPGMWNGALSIGSLTGSSSSLHAGDMRVYSRALSKDEVFRVFGREG
jgi:hypothetical protein